jgi:hypothetical protein
MNDPVTAPEDSVQALRRQFLGHAAAAFDLLFHPDHQPDLVTFEQREQRAHELSADLETWLLQQHVNADPLACPPPETPVPCPHCGKPAQLVPRPDRPLFQRTLTTRAGEVVLKRRQWRCATCRVAFFPSGPPAGAGR